MRIFKRLCLAVTACLTITLPACTPAPEGMVKIPGGTFIMGSNREDTEGRAEELGIVIPWFENEHPQRILNLPTYFIDITEVTNADYARFVAETARRIPEHWKGEKTPPEGLENHPVTHVDWFDARDYCKWAGKELPTEPQWEKAARGNMGLIFPWGNEFKASAANVNGTNTTEVGSYPAGASPYGVLDMTGNVWEWSADWYQPYPGNGKPDRKYGEKYRVVRGSSWASVGHYPSKEELMEIVMNNARTSFRLYVVPAGRLNDVGFRCVKNP